MTKCELQKQRNSYNYPAIIQSHTRYILISEAKKMKESEKQEKGRKKR